LAKPAPTNPPACLLSRGKEPQVAGKKGDNVGAQAEKKATARRFFHIVLRIEKKYSGNG